MAGVAIMREGQLGDADYEDIISFLNGDSAVTDLCLNWNYLISADLDILGRAIECSETLQRIDLSHNFLGDAGVLTLLEHLGPSVEAVVLCDNDISDVGARALIERLTRLSSPLLEIVLDFNRISAQVLKRLQRETTTKIKRLQRNNQRGAAGHKRRCDRLLQVVDTLEAENRDLRRERGRLKGNLQRVRSSKKGSDQRADLAAQQLENATDDAARAQRELEEAEKQVEVLQEQTRRLTAQLLDGGVAPEEPPAVDEGPVEHSLSFACKICQDRPISCVFIPCGHLAACMDCGTGLRNCPICRALNTKVLRCFTT